MAAPAASGAYALLLDGVRKYNLKNPSRPLSSDASVLRDILIHTARPFDVTRYNPSTGETLLGQYTWVDEGTGMIDLTAAWKKLFEMRDQPLPTAVNLEGKSVELDYQVIVPMKAPNGNLYDGSKPGSPGNPAFGTGVYLSTTDTETLRQVSIARRLPEKLAASGAAGELMRQLKTTQDEFTLKTMIYGSNIPWIQVGSLDQLGCQQTDNARLNLVGEGAIVHLAADGSGTLNGSPVGTLNLCINRTMVRELPAGDHGALIFAYRTVNGRLAPYPSFTVPVYLTVPHQTLEHSTAYEIQDEVTSFGVKRNYIQIPKGTNMVKVTLEVPDLRASAPDSNCSGVELMALTGTNISKPFKTRQEARTSNCDGLGRPLTGEAKKPVTFTQTNPTPGIWDLAVFGNYKYARSKYTLRVDYFAATSNVKEIKGDISALNGNLTLSIKEASLDLNPDLEKSNYVLFGLQAGYSGRITQGEHLMLPSNGSNVFRRYAADVKKVAIKLGGSPGNDLDLFVLECAADAALPTDPSCSAIAKSDGPSDQEMVAFAPKQEKAYAVQIDGVDVKSNGSFVCEEALLFQPERGALAITKNQDVFDVGYTWEPSSIRTSKLLNDENFRAGRYQVIGALILKTRDDTTLAGVPVAISASARRGG
jgi:hypothetical protein